MDANVTLGHQSFGTAQANAAQMDYRTPPPAGGIFDVAQNEVGSLIHQAMNVADRLEVIGERLFGPVPQHGSAQGKGQPISGGKTHELGALIEHGKSVMDRLTLAAARLEIL